MRLLPLLFLAPFAAAAEDRPVMRVHFINVGQGAATLVELPCGAMLIDTGGEMSREFDSDAALSAYLAAFFARRADLHGTLDLLWLTHPHIDHVHGVPLVLGAYAVRNIVDNGQPGDQEDVVPIIAGLREYEAAHPEVGAVTVSTHDFATGGAGLTGAVIDPFGACKGADPAVSALWGRATADPGWGEDDYGKRRFDNANNHSAAVRVDLGESSLVVTGDLEAVAIRDLLASRSPAALDADIYEVGHHGSANGTTAELLAAVSPEWAVMEVGPAERKVSWSAWAYGHPRTQAVELLEAGVSGTRAPVQEPVGSGVRAFVTEDIDRAIYATGWDGALVLEADAAGAIRLVAPDVVQPAHPELTPQ